MGEGPGEFAGATRVVALANGHSLVPDQTRGIFHEYLPNGQFRRQAQLGDVIRSPRAFQWGTTCRTLW